jgi:RHS repeat-associated protein
MTGQGSEVSGTSSYTYDEHGELVSETDARGITTDRTIDEADRVTLVDPPGTDLDTTYAYGTNAASFEKCKLISITRDSDVVSYTWDRFGRKLTDGELAYTYDKNGNRTRVTYPGDLKATSTFDRMDREDSLTLQQGAGAITTVVSTGATYKAFGPLTSMSHPATTVRTVTRGYDLRYAPTSIVISTSSPTPETLLDWSYTVDGAGNPTAVQQSQPAAVSRSYGYQDMQYFLTSATGPWSGPLSWSYDKIGNRLTETNGALTDSYSYAANSGNTGNTATLDLVSLGVGGTRDYTFDLGGYLDLVDAGANDVDFMFDAAGQLGQASRAVAGETADFFYDGRGYLRQVIATMPASGGPPGGDLPFLDGFESGDVCEWSTAVGWAGTACPTTIEMSLTVLYDSEGRLHGLQSETGDPQRVLYFAGAPIAIYDAGPVPSLTILTTDHLGTPIHAMDSAGATTWLGGFGPFGEDYTSPSAQESGIFLRLPGQWSDGIWGGATLGAEVYYNLHRWYEPQLGRYSRPDPLGFDEGDWSLFAYAASSPLLRFDPDGLAALAPGNKCNGFDRAIQKLQRTKENCECLAYFRDELNGDLPALLDGALPQVKIKQGPGSASTPCGGDPGAIWIDPKFCRLGYRGKLPNIILHELAHFADCRRQRFPPGGATEEGAEAERKCLGSSADSKGR